MSIITATAAQRAELHAALSQCGKDLHRFVERANTPTTDEAAELADSISRAVAALSAAGYSTVPDGSAVVANSSTVAVRNSAGADSHDATAVVTDTSLTGVNLAATTALVDQGDSVDVRNSAGADAHAGTAQVANGVISSVRLAATVALVDNGDTITATGTGTTATLAVANGVLTGVTLS